MDINLSKINKVHFIGIKGVAMSGLSVICKQRGMEVAGSDVAKEFITDKVLNQEGIYVFQEFNPKNLDWSPDLVVVGASWGEDNFEYAQALQKKIPIINESDLRGLLSKEKITIAVTGAHGKTTTTSLLSYIFTLAGLDPSYLIGTGLIPDLGINGHWGGGKYFIVEGDEYIKSKKERTPKFLDLSPDATIITNIEWEHVDVYKKVQDMEKVFKKLVKKTKSFVAACCDWQSVENVIGKNNDKVSTYGNKMCSKWRIGSYTQKLNESYFTVFKDNQVFGEFELRLLGRFNAINAIGCMIVALHYGIGIEVIHEAFKNFSGLERRMDTDHKKDITFIDDYGHHPTEVSETLHAIRDMYVKRNIICVFQPHTASRTLAFLHEFGKCFKDVDEVILLDIFTSAREKEIGITTQDVYETIKKYHPNVHYFGSMEDAAKNILSEIKPRDVVVTMGAGDVYKIKKYLMDNV